MHALEPDISQQATPPRVFAEGELVAVQTTQPLDKTLDYKAPPGGVRIGALVEVPLGPRKVIGVVWGEGIGGFDLSKARSIAAVLDVPPLDARMRSFLERVGAYTLTPMPNMLRLGLRAPGLGTPPGMRKVYRLGFEEPPRMTAAREKVLAVLEEHQGFDFGLKELADAAGVSPSVVKGLVEAGAVMEVAEPRDAPYPVLDPELPGKALSDGQATVAAQLCTKQQSGAYSTVLLKGVTGSGKTEVYLEVVAEALRQGRQALVLLPEIALTVEFLARVEARFGARPAEWHSGVTMAARRRCWKAVAAGEVQLVVGARSALFLPFDDLGLVVVDEEHDGSYKQDDGVLYSARDMAVLRASLTKALVVLASATPSLESWANAKAGKYDRLDLPERFGTARLPEMRAVDMRNDRPGKGRWVSDTLAREVFARLERGEQSLLFLNRRGYAPVTQCRACGEPIACADCDARMVEHRFHAKLICHQCGDSRAMPQRCLQCDAEDTLNAIGPGVERLAEEAVERFGDARIAVLSSDMALSARALKARIEEIAGGSADIIIGTQLVAKGHNFPLLTLVGVIDADLGLQGGDLRAAEKTFQLVRQVAGRAGRADKPGLALVQTHQPAHPVIEAILSGDEEEFWATEAAQRQQAGSPPFGRMAGIIVSGPDLGQLEALVRGMARNAEPLRAVGAQLFGPAPAPIARIRGRHRIRFLIKAAKATPIQRAITDWLAPVPVPANVRIAVDIDPQSFF